MTGKKAIEVEKILASIEDKATDAQSDKHRLLEAQGWKRTCATPYSRWAWIKKLNEVIKIDGDDVNPVVIVNTEDALLYVKRDMEENYPDPDA